MTKGTGTKGTGKFQEFVRPEIFEELPVDAVAINYLFHSCLLVRIRKVLMLFDFAMPGDHPADSLLGLFPLELLEPYELFVFASHAHLDHFSPAIFEMPARDKTHLFVGDDIEPTPSRQDVVVCRPGEWQERAGARVVAFRSSDEGVAFLVEVEGLRFYHSGDNGFWDKEKGLSVEQGFRPFLQPIMDTKKSFDVAFQVADPRFPESHYGGIHDVSAFLDIGLLVPIHNFNDFSHHGTMRDLVAANHPGQDYWDIEDNGALLVRTFHR